MKYVKMLGLLTVAAAALMSFAATASATILTAPTGTLYTGNLHATSEGKAVLHSEDFTIECDSTVEGTITQHGTNQTVKGNITTLTFTPCNNFWHVTPTKNADNTYGQLEVHWINEHEGTVTSSNTTVATTRLGVNCYYKTNNTHIGTLTDSHIANGATTEKPTMATFDISAQIPIEEESSGLCGKGNAAWTGSYTINTPAELYIDK